MMHTLDEKLDPGLGVRGINMYLSLSLSLSIYIYIYVTYVRWVFDSGNV